METPLDIETIPAQPQDEVMAEIAATIQHPASMKKQETIDAWHAGEGQYAGVKEALIEEQYRKTALDGSLGQICSIAWSAGIDGEIESLFATPGVRTEADLLSDFFDALRAKLNGRSPWFIGHYIGGFDLPFLYQRAVINKVDPGMKLGQHGRHDRDFFDTMVEWAGWKGSISLDRLCKALGLKVEKPEGIDGAHVWDFYQEGKYDEIRIYNCKDVDEVRMAYKRLRFILS